MFSTIWKQQGCFSLDCKDLISMVASVFLWTCWVYWGSWLSEELEAVSLRGIQTSLGCDGSPPLPENWAGLREGMRGEGWLWGSQGIPSVFATSWLVLCSVGSTVPSAPPWWRKEWLVRLPGDGEHLVILGFEGCRVPAVILLMS